jgi:hypothetical protein
MNYPAEIAEYLALASTLRDGEGPATYRRANQLSFFLAMVLPAAEYEALIQAMLTKTWQAKLDVVASYGDVGADKIALHGPGVGAEIPAGTALRLPD